MRILATDLKGSRPIVAVHTGEYGSEFLHLHNSDGSYHLHREDEYDLYNPTEQSVYEVCILPDRYGGVGLLNSRLVPHNVRLAFEGDKLVAVQLIGGE